MPSLEVMAHRFSANGIRTFFTGAFDFQHHFRIPHNDGAALD